MEGFKKVPVKEVVDKLMPKRGGQVGMNGLVFKVTGVSHKTGYVNLKLIGLEKQK